MSLNSSNRDLYSLLYVMTNLNQEQIRLLSLFMWQLSSLRQAHIAWAKWKS